MCPNKIWSSAGWAARLNNCLPFLQYLPGIVLKAYREFENRVEHVGSSKLNKTERIRMLFEQETGKITKADVARFCPDISVSPIERTTGKMLENGELRIIGASRSTAYVKL